MIPARLTVVTLGARHLGAMRAFYVGLGWPLAVDLDEFVAFRLRGAVLALFGLEELAAEAGVAPAVPQSGMRGVALAINVDERAQVDETIEGVRARGARITKEPVDAEWGGRSGYFADPEGNHWEVAWVPLDNPMAAALRSATDGPPSAAVDHVREATDFIAAAERATNAYDLDGVMSVYAPEILLESVTDGARELHRGAAAVRRAWAAYLGGFRARRLTLSKHLVSATADTVVNEWRGAGAHRHARGIEVWRRSPTGEVVEHRLFTFLDVRPSDGMLARLRLFVTAPRTALALLRAQRRAGG